VRIFFREEREGEEHCEERRFEPLGRHDDFIHATRRARLLLVRRVCSVPTQADETTHGSIAALRPEKAFNEIPCIDVRRRRRRARSARINS
jgi:hypothetical protein